MTVVIGFRLASVLANLAVGLARCVDYRLGVAVRHIDYLIGEGMWIVWYGWFNVDTLVCFGLMIQ